MKTLRVTETRNEVSIPERVLEALKLMMMRSPPPSKQNVSIPERVLEALKPRGFHSGGDR